MPAHFTYWRYPVPGTFTVSPRCRPNTLKVVPSKLNLTALNGNYAGPTGQAFVGRRQQDTLFTYSVHLDFAPKLLEEEAGVTAFLTQNHHLDLGVVLLPANASNTAFPGTSLTAPEDPEKLLPHVRFRGISYIAVPDPIIVPLPPEWAGETLSLEIKASNMTHYSFSVGPATARSEMKTILYASNAPVSWGFTGKIETLPLVNLLHFMRLTLLLQESLSEFMQQAMAVKARLPHISRSGGTYLKANLETEPEQAE